LNLNKKSILQKFFALILFLFGATLGTLVAERVGWSHGDWIQLSQSFGLWLTGGAGAWFVWQQNRILQSQNSIMELQLAHEQSLLALQNDRERSGFIKTAAKVEFRRAGTQRGLIQMAADGLARRFPTALQTILEAYTELANEEPHLGLLRKNELLDLLRGFNANIVWPE